MPDIETEIKNHIKKRYTEILDDSAQGASLDLAELWTVIISVLDGASYPDGSTFDLSSIRELLSYKIDEEKEKITLDANRILEIDFNQALELIYALVSITLNLDDEIDDEGNIKSKDGEINEYLTSLYSLAMTALLKLGLILTEESENPEE